VTSEPEVVQPDPAREQRPASVAGRTAAALDLHPVQRRTVAVLSGAQVLGGLGVGAAVAVGGLIAAGVTGSEGAAGLAQTSSVVGAAVMALPLVRLTDRFGRRVGLSTGLVMAAGGAALVVVSAQAGWTALMFVGFLVTGSATAAGLQARYAATDLAEPRHRARALSIVVWATTVGAVAGPNLSDPSGRIALRLGLPELTGGYLITVCATGLAATLVMVGLRPDPLLTARARAADRGTPHAPHPRLRHSLEVIRGHQGAVLGLAAIAVAHTAMVAVMVMTPIHMRHVDVSLTIIGLVLSVHILGMYAFSPLVGLASDRFGRVPLIVMGCVLLLAACAVAGTAPADDALQLGIGLFLLGLGWSCGLVAGSTLLTESVPEAERPGAQGASDLVMNVCAAVGGAIAGVIVAVSTYGWLTTLAAIPVVLLLGWALVRRS
jgi:MFS family permease